MGNDLQVREGSMLPTRAEAFQFLGGTLADARQFAATLVASTMFEVDRRPMKPEEALVLVLKGRELGLPPLFSLSHVRMVKGNPTIAAEAMLALVLKQGCTHRWVSVTTDAATLELTRPGGSKHSETFTMEDAQRAGLVKPGSGWEKFPKAMLRARAITAACRAFCPDMIMGISYTAEELGAEETGEGVDMRRVESAPEETEREQARKEQDEATEREVLDVKPEQPKAAEGTVHDDTHLTITIAHRQLVTAAKETAALLNPGELDPCKFEFALTPGLAKKAGKTKMTLADLTDQQIASLTTAYKRMAKKESEKKADEPKAEEPKPEPQTTQVLTPRDQKAKQIASLAEECGLHIPSDGEDFFDPDGQLDVPEDMAAELNLPEGPVPIVVLTEKQMESVIAYLNKALEGVGG